MAAPTTTAPRKRVQGPRTAKPKTGYLLFKGQLDGDVAITFDAHEAMDKRDSDPDLKAKKFVIAPGPKRASANQTPTPPTV